MSVDPYGRKGRNWTQPGGREAAKRRHPARYIPPPPLWAIQSCNLHSFPDKYTCPACIERGDEDNG